MESDKEVKLDSQRLQEINFWTTLFNDRGEEKYLKMRYSDYLWRTKFFKDELEGEMGKGLDLGCGLVSIFEFTNLDMTACDPLRDFYDEIYKQPNRKLDYVTTFVHTERMIMFNDNQFDYIICFNVIDHTKNPNHLAKEIYRILKPNGHLYLEVNWDDELGLPHYELWNDKIVNQNFPEDKWHLIKSKTTRNPSYPQDLYEAFYHKRQI